MSLVTQRLNARNQAFGPRNPRFNTPFISQSSLAIDLFWPIQFVFGDLLAEDANPNELDRLSMIDVQGITNIRKLLSARESSLIRGTL